MNLLRRDAGAHSGVRPEDMRIARRGRPRGARRFHRVPRRRLARRRHRAGPERPRARAGARAASRRADRVPRLGPATRAPLRPQRRKTMRTIARTAWRTLAARPRRRRARRRRADRDHDVLPRGRRRPDHQDRRPDGRRLREGKPRHQGEARVRGHLPGDHREGAHRPQERHAAHDGHPAVHRHVHADRRGRDRALRGHRGTARRRGVAQVLLPGVHGQQPDRRQDLGHPVPALDHRPLLEQGALQGGRPRPEQAAGQLEGDARVRAEAHEEGRLGQRHPVGRADPLLGLPLLAVPGAHDRPTGWSS